MEARLKEVARIGKADGPGTWQRKPQYN